MVVEAFHRVFKYNYLKGKVNKRVDKCLVNLLEFLRDKYFERLVKLTKGRSCKKLKDINDRHSRSMQMSTDCVVEVESRKWKVKSQDGKRSYDIIKQCESCTDASCSLRCQRCNICVHIFLCNCPDSLIQSTICKHVHLLQTALATKEIKENCDITDIPSTFDHCDADRKAYIKEEVKVLANNMPKQRERNEVGQVIKRLQGHFQQIDTDINSGCHSKDSLLHFKKQILAAKSLLDATSNKTPLRTLPVANIPGNKRIEPQARFFSTKKKRKHTNHLRFTKPSDDDIKKIFGTKRPKNEYMPEVKVAGTQKGKVGQKKSGLSCI